MATAMNTEWEKRHSDSERLIKTLRQKYEKSKQWKKQRRVDEKSQVVLGILLTGDAEDLPPTAFDYKVLYV